MPPTTALAALQALLPQVDSDRLTEFLDFVVSPTVFVAASDASAGSIARAAPEYRCDGVADNVEIQAALDALPT